MKLDGLTKRERTCYEDLSCADRWGGDCSTQGYAWAAFDDDMIVIVENDQGFVDAVTYTSRSDYGYNVALLIAKDLSFDEQLETCV